jgi:hypothetical protein
MVKFPFRALAAALVSALGLAAPAWAADADDAAALDLKPQSEEPAPKAGSAPLKAFVELTAGRLQQRFGLPSEDVRRASLDLVWTYKPADRWRVVLSDRLDDIHPLDHPGARSTLNSLREAYLGWHSEDGRQAADLGRINVRYGPAYGFNPTDYFRDGSSRAVTTADPLALRENRLGTVMLRGQQLWDGGSVSLALAPKLRDGPSQETFSVDLGSTNHADRALLALSLQAGPSWSLQGFAFHERGKGLQVGANASGVLGNATVVFAEWSRGRDHDLLSEALGAPKVVTRQRAAAGLTYTTPTRLSLTAELEYNGFALDRAGWDQAAASLGAEALGAYQLQVQRRQDIASRKAVLLYASQRDAGLKNLDLTGLVRYNTEDHSRFLWAEARYHFNKVDVALQWQANRGRVQSEYGGLAGRSLVQLLAAFYF